MLGVKLICKRRRNVTSTSTNTRDWCSLSDASGWPQVRAVHRNWQEPGELQAEVDICSLPTVLVDLTNL